MVQAVTLTLAEAAAVLEPSVTEPQLRAIVTALGWQPDGYRHTGRAGRPVAAYDATRLMRLHAAISPFNDRIPYANAQATALPEMTGEQ